MNESNTIKVFYHPASALDKIQEAIEALKIKRLTEDQREDILGELSASLSHLKIHSNEVEEAIDKTD